jgi:threonine dehydrogenase-like Zn-dependent dehydrogenase
VTPAVVTQRRAVRWHAVDDVRLDAFPEIDAAALPTGHVLVAVEGCGICGTDVAIARGVGDEVPTEPHGTTGCRAPLALGHEIVGRVVAGDDALVGSRVVVWPYVTCSQCDGPRGVTNGICHRCPLTGHLGINAHGGMADSVVARADCCVPIADTVPLDSAVLCEPLAVVLHAFRSAGVGAPGRVAIVGGGSIGLCGVDVAWFRGAKEVIVIDSHEGARQAALAAGAGVALSPEQAADVAADVVLEASGSPSGLNTAIRCCAPGGRVLVVGDNHEPEPIDLENLLMREIVIVGSVGHDFRKDFSLAARAIGKGELGARPRPVIHVGLEEAPVIVMGRSDARAGSKVVVLPSLSSRMDEQ